MSKRLAARWCAVGVFILTTSALLSPAAAVAAEPSNPQIDSALAAYSQRLAAHEKTLSSSHSGKYLNLFRNQSGQQMPTEADAAAEAGAKLTSVSVSTHVDSLSQSSGSSYSAVVSVTTSTKLTAEPSGYFHIAGEKRNTLDSSSTDVYDMTLVRSGAGYTVAKDTVRPEEDDENGNLTNLNSKVAMQGRKLLHNQLYTAPKEFGTNSEGLNYIKAINYAEKWTDAEHKDSMNPKYPIYSDNCTNFVSQALYEGGLPTTGTGLLTDIYDPTAWNYSVMGTTKATHTWGGAENNFVYMKDSSRSFSYYESSDAADHAWEGSIIYGDWNNDGKMNHAMYVVGYYSHGKAITPVICQKTNNRHEVLFSVEEQRAQRSHPRTKWHLLQYKYE